MCGIAGFTLPTGVAPGRRMGLYGERLRRMTASLFHRGPDAQRGVLLNGAALGHTRLAIVDLASGQQPMSDPDTGLTVVFNGEIFNHVELRRRLSPRYRFKTHCDTEVILAAFLQEGIACLDRFIGQFAFALWDPRDRSLWLARDRVGVRPLYYRQDAHELAFASEAKALFAGGLEPRLDPVALVQTLHLWAPAPRRSAFAEVQSLPPGCYARYRGGALTLNRYWDLDLGPGCADEAIGEVRAQQELEELLEDAVRLRLRADVPVAAYLSGGLDSSLICSIAQAQLGGNLHTYSVEFEQARYDERGHQGSVASWLGTRHHSVLADDRGIGESLPAVIEHAEQLLLRSAPAPFLRLSGLVRSNGIKVVLSGEGADELFWGYDLFREAAVRQFWSRQPQSAARPRLLSRLHAYLPLGRNPDAVIRQFYGAGLDRSQAPEFSHLPRWSNSGRVSRFLSRPFLETATAHGSPVAELLEGLPRGFVTWPLAARAQYLEMQTLLSGYLLSAQGDRMLMAHSVEGRFPFLDHRVIEFAARLPPRLKRRGLQEKVILKHLAGKRLPEAVATRRKFPYRSPIAEALTGRNRPEWSRDLLTPEAVDNVGVFDGAMVGRLLAKLSAQAGHPSEADNMSLMAVASAQLLATQFGPGRTLERGKIDAVALHVPTERLAA